METTTTKLHHNFVQFEITWSTFWEFVSNISMWTILSWNLVWLQWNNKTNFVALLVRIHTLILLYFNKLQIWSRWMVLEIIQFGWDCFLFPVMNKTLNWLHILLPVLYYVERHDWKILEQLFSTFHIFIIKEWN